MARPHPVAGLDPDQPALEAARRILAVRMAELLAFEPAVAHPAQAELHHDMRIAAKRLRYSLEIFGSLLPEDVTQLTRETRSIQEHLGHVHDYDMLVPWFEDYRAFRQLEATNRLRRATIASPAKGDGKPSVDDYRAAVQTAADPDEDEAILRLIERTRARRETAFTRFQSYFRELLANGFADRLQHAIES
jgi:CHAD domain-containing protein